MSVRADLQLRRGSFTLSVQLDLPERGVTALFGPSGAGKTTLLRCLAGLERAAGFLEVGGACWQDDVRGTFVPAHRRRIGYVFQDARLFSHLPVLRNLEYGYRRTAKFLRQISLERVLELLGIGHLLDRYPHQLSGGEQRRVAIGRALLTSPRLLLMDEPLAGLDQARAAEIFPYLEHLRDELSLPIIYVSHHLEEVTRLADYLVLLEAGRIRAVGALQEVIARLDLPLAVAPDAGALIQARVVDHDDEFHLTYLDFGGGRLTIVRQARARGQELRVRIAARDVSLALERPAHSSILNIFEARIAEIVTDGPAQMLVKLAVGDSYLLARVTRKSHALLGLETGTRVFAQVKSVALMKGDE